MPKPQKHGSSRLTQLSISLAVFVCLTAEAFAFDADYYRTLARSYLADGEVDRAFDAAKAGLGEHPGDPELAKIRDEIEKGKADAATAKRHSQELTEKAAVAKRVDDEKAFLPKAYCACLATKSRAEKKIAKEEEVGAVAGVVDKIALRQAGLTVVNIKRTISFMTKDAARLGLKVGDCGSEKSNEVEDAFACDTYYVRNRRDIENE